MPDTTIQTQKYYGRMGLIDTAEPMLQVGKHCIANSSNLDLQAFI